MYRLVVAEDEIEIRRGLVELFPWAELGFDLVADFGSGREAIEYLSRENVDVVIADIKMRDGDGFDVAAFLASNRRLETLVFYSAYKDFDFARKGMALGVRYYVTKDMGFPELVEAFKGLKAELDERVSASGWPSAEPEGESANPIVGNTLRYLSKCYRTASLQSAAKVVHLNPCYLSAYIKAKTGSNFREILTRIRMEKAKELLRDPAYRASEIGRLLGYSDPRNFQRCFKHYFGMSTSDFKRESGPG